MTKYDEFRKATNDNLSISYSDYLKIKGAPKLSKGSFWSMRYKLRGELGGVAPRGKKSRMKAMQVLVEFRPEEAEGAKIGVLFLIKRLNESPLSQLVHLRLLQDENETYLIVNTKG